MGVDYVDHIFCRIVSSDTNDEPLLESTVECSGDESLHIQCSIQYNVMLIKYYISNQTVSCHVISIDREIIHYMVDLFSLSSLTFSLSLYLSLSRSVCVWFSVLLLHISFILFMYIHVCARALSSLFAVPVRNKNHNQLNYVTVKKRVVSLISCSKTSSNCLVTEFTRISLQKLN